MLLCLFVKLLLQVGVTLKKGGVRGMGWVVWSHSRERVGDPPCGSDPTSLHRPQATPHDSRNSVLSFVIMGLRHSLQMYSHHRLWNVSHSSYFSSTLWELGRGVGPFCMFQGCFEEQYNFLRCPELLRCARPIAAGLGVFSLQILREPFPQSLLYPFSCASNKQTKHYTTGKRGKLLSVCLFLYF